jgi:xanthine dehydrogenase iron-sulfur cluster and FAD-binding subunit A
MALTSTAQPGTISTPDKIRVMLVLNGAETQLCVAPWTTLLDALRDHLDTKKGCDHGQCGACTVLADGRRINSCLALAVMKDGAKVTTIEGLPRDGVLHAFNRRSSTMTHSSAAIARRARYARPPDWSPRARRRAPTRFANS